MSDKAFERLCERARQEVDERLPACQLAVAKDGELIGFETISRTGAETNEHRFLMWSCTKAVVAGVVWQLVGEGLLDVERRVAEYIPEFATNGKDVITVEQILLHTAGIPQAPLGPHSWGTTEGRRAAFAKWRLNWEPGSRFEYHALSAWWVLAELIVEVTGNGHHDEVRRRIAEPLGLRTLQLGVPEAEQGDVAKLEAVGQRATEEEHRAAGVYWSSGASVDVPPVLALALGTPAALEVGIPGAGAVATAADLALYYQALLRNPDELWDPAVLADGTGVVRNCFPDLPKRGLPANRTRGLVVRGDHEGAHWMMHFGRGTSPRTFGHDGAGGQIAWADPESGLSFAFLTNGMDANVVREITRCQDLATLAAACG